MATKSGLANDGKCEFAAMKLERQRPVALQTPFIWNHSATVCLGTQLRGSEGRERFVITTVLRNTSDGHYYYDCRYYYYAGLTLSSHNTDIRDRLPRLADGNVYQEQCATIKAQPEANENKELKWYERARPTFLRP